MSKQPEALRLASVPIIDRGIGWQADATATLKRQHALIADLVEALRWAMNFVPNRSALERYGLEVNNFEGDLEAARAVLARAGEQQ